ncbi:MAG: GDP-mannose 4,6-dehydratase [Planctomycetota bacterium]|nr:GDP-mannose 4,6-dehydratase [Planctomycetota bacterium]
MRKRALITGITGQDGSYLAELLLAENYEVHGTVRRASIERLDRIEKVIGRINLHQADLLDQNSLMNILKEVEPDEVYNLAAQSFVPTSWKQPIYTGEVNAIGVTRLLEAIRLVNKGIKFYQASSSEMFGNTPYSPQNEETPFYPRSPYAVSKIYGHYITMNYRDSYGMFCCSGILFNHESPRRGEEFVTRKITLAAARIKLGLQEKLKLGNLDAKRDWGFAGDYVRAVYLMMQHNQPDVFVIATGVAHSVRDFCKAAFECVDLNWENYVEVDSSLIRPADVNHLVGDSSKARKLLKWKPEVSFEQLIEMMVASDIELVKRRKG